MHWTEVLGLMGGLALFLYGMRLMSEGMELLAGSRLKSILERLTRNRVLAMLVGMALTAVVQSSNAVTAMTVGFVNAGLMEFPRAIGVIMGANIGTTMTGQLIALNVTQIAPLFAFSGVVMFLFFQNKHVRHLGQVLAGLGILFMGMSVMSESMAPLKDVAWFRNAMVSFSNPLLGVAVGALFTLLVQSSSASIGVMQAMAMQGLIGLNSAIYVLCGQNIGCTIAAIMAAIGGNKGAKRTALVHLLFNVIGTLLFIIVCQLTPFVSWVESFTPGNGAAQIANAHTIFNVATTLLLLPCSNMLAKIAIRLIPGEDETEGATHRLLHITQTFGAASIGIAQVEAEIGRMEGLAYGNMHTALDALFTKGTQLDAVHRNEDTIDYLNKEITHALVRLNATELTVEDADHISSMYHVISDLERIGDHAENIAGYAEFLRDQSRGFSEKAVEGLRELTGKVYAIMDDAYALFRSPQPGRLDKIAQQEQDIDDMVDLLQAEHIQRLTANECSTELGMLYVEILTDLERAADHALNIAEAARP